MCSGQRPISCSDVDEKAKKCVRDEPQAKVIHATKINHHVTNVSWFPVKRTVPFSLVSWPISVGSVFDNLFDLRSICFVISVSSP